jgi:prepilin-type N-terminal cleavage/methylation domain-containing protein
MNISRKLYKNSCGFTLVEILTAIGIIGVLVLIGIPAFRAYQPNLQLNGAVRNLVTDIRYAQQLAVTEQIDHGIHFSSSTNEYDIIKYTEPEQIIEQKILPEKVDFQQISGFTDNKARFNPYGAVKESGAIILVNTRNTTSTIEIRPSGFVKIIK